MMPTIYLLIMMHGAVHFMIPMKDDPDLCFTNGRDMAAMLKTDKEIAVGCFDVAAQSFVFPRRAMPQMAPPGPSEPMPERQAEEKID